MKCHPSHFLESPSVTFSKKRGTDEHDGCEVRSDGTLGFAKRRLNSRQEEMGLLEDPHFLSKSCDSTQYCSSYSNRQQDIRSIPVD
jgi:hypothetical protein